MLSIILVNWNGWADTICCIQSLLNSEASSSRIIVVDNMSTNDSLAAFKKWVSRELELIRDSNRIECLSTAGANQPRKARFVVYLEQKNTFVDLENNEIVQEDDENCIYFVVSGRNGGFGFGCNVGMRLGEHLGSVGYWLLNNDCVVPPESLPKVADAIKRKSNTAFGTVVRYYNQPDSVQSYGGGSLSRLTGRNIMAVKARSEKPLDYIYGASMVFSSQILTNVGYFDEKIFMYYEEIDFCIRISQAGYAMDMIEADVFHRHGGSQGGPSLTAWRNVFVNKWYVLKKHFSWGSWCFFYIFSLLVRCINPLASKNSVRGARLALNALVFKRMSQ